MSIKLIKESVITLLKEIYNGQRDPNGPTWVVSSGPDAGIFGTFGGLSARHAAIKPAGVAHSIAEHVAHLKFTLDVNLRYAKGEQPAKLDWESSWRTPDPLTEESWKAMQDSLKSSHGALLDWATHYETFSEFDSVCGFSASAAHSAYHLGAIRQLAAIVRMNV